MQTNFSETVELLQRAQAGEQDCLGRVLERYRGPLLTRIRLMMGDEARTTAESGDFLHGVFVRILENFDGFEIRDERSFLRWAVQIARNGIRDRVRRKRELALGSLITESGHGRAAAAPTPSQDAARSEQVASLVDAIAELDEDQRRVVELRHFEHLPFAEIGQRMGRSQNAVQLLHARVMTRLSAALGTD